MSTNSHNSNNSNIDTRQIYQNAYTKYGESVLWRKFTDLQAEFGDIAFPISFAKVTARISCPYIATVGLGPSNYFWNRMSSKDESWSSHDGDEAYVTQNAILCDLSHPLDLENFSPEKVQEVLNLNILNQEERDTFSTFIEFNRWLNDQLYIQN